MVQTLEKYRELSTNKSMGIEIECYYPFPGYHEDEETRLRRSTIPPEYQHVGFFYMGSDGSIESPNYRDYKMEMVSQPLSVPWLKKEIQKLGRKYKWETNSSCGIHIHVSRKWLSIRRAQMIWSFLQTQTDRHDLLAWFGRRPNHYSEVDDSKLGSSRYLAINTMNDKTIEFRMFRSGGPDWACYCVDMVEYLIKNADHLNVDAVDAFSDMHKGRIAP